ncbi:putative dUTP diphosphatase [Delftia phage PhiW-14]|uniref:Putative dUTP diphosphatase n=1 Tax=Delftia phage PhiW-14 TaxID=665032 RepID=C9DGK3_BPW14|nr:putative dUTP diphosphatase [Delftia phage PhiW-14]ACV50254.1 putative dUTP diphosphatase [Delftia phage PhiW-14]
MNTFLSKDEIVDLIEDQIKLNRVFDPQDKWLAFDFVHRLDSAIYSEWGEFLAEINKVWKWYDPKAPEVDVAKAVFELVDVTKFMISRLLNRGLKLEDASQYAGNRVPYEDMGAMYALSQAQSAFSRGMNPNDGAQLALRNLDDMLFYACSMFNISKATFLDAMNQKDQRCHNRANAGQMQGVDVKSAEKPLELRIL